jgi:hypothetical protein
LPEDALFCHRCGKPQREDLIPTEEEAPAAGAAQRPVEPQLPGSVPRGETGLHARIAVRSALLVGIGSLLVISLPLPAAIHRLWVLGWLLFSGFLAVALYSRRTGESVPLRTGLRIGWLTGFFCCLVASALLGLVAFIARSRGGFQEMLREAMNRKDIPEDQGAQMIEMLSQGEALVFALLVGFLLFTSLSAIGGLVGARLLRKDT